MRALEEIRRLATRRRRVERLDEDVERLIGMLEALIEDVHGEAGPRAAATLRRRLAEALAAGDASCALRAARRISGRREKNVGRPPEA